MIFHSGKKVVTIEMAELFDVENPELMKALSTKVDSPVGKAPKKAKKKLLPLPPIRTYCHS